MLVRDQTSRLVAESGSPSGHLELLWHQKLATGTRTGDPWPPCLALRSGASVSQWHYLACCDETSDAKTTVELR